MDDFEHCDDIVFDDEYIDFPTSTDRYEASVPICDYSFSENEPVCVDDEQPDPHREQPDVELDKPLFLGCNVDVGDFIMEINSIKILTHCSWKCIEMFLALAKRIMHGLADLQLPNTLSSIKTLSSRLFKRFGVTEDVFHYGHEYFLCGRCGTCVPCSEETCSTCGVKKSSDEKRYVHFSLTNSLTNRMKLPAFVNSLKNGYNEYLEDIAQENAGMEGAYRLNVRRLVTEGYVKSFRDIIVNICIDGVTIGKYSGQTAMSFTPIMAQVASLKYADRVNTNNLILVGLLEGSANECQMDGPIDVLIDDILSSRETSAELRVIFGYLAADHQCLRKLIKGTGDASVCPCERCRMSGTLHRAEGAHGPGRYLYPFESFSSALCYRSHDEIVSKINQLIAIRLRNISSVSTTRREDGEVKEFLRSFSYYGRTRFLRLPEFRFLASVPIDLMHIASNAGEFVREYLRSNLTKPKLDIIDDVIASATYPSENRSSVRAFTYGRKWKTVDYLHFLLFELPVFARRRDVIPEKKLRLALLSLSGIVKIASCVDVPKSGIVPLQKLCMTFGACWYAATGLSGAKLWSHRLLHYWQVLLSCGVSSDAWLFIFERAMGSLSRAVQSPNLAYAQLRNSAPFMELHRLWTLAGLKEDDGHRHVGITLDSKQQELFDVTLLGRRTGTHEVTDKDRNAVILELLTLDESLLQRADTLISAFRRRRGKAEYRGLKDPESVARYIVRIQAKVNAAEVVDDELCDLAKPFEFGQLVHCYERIEFAASRGKLYLVSSRWGAGNSSHDFEFCFTRFSSIDEQQLCVARAAEFRAVELSSGKYVVLINAEGVRNVINNNSRAGQPGVSATLDDESWLVGLSAVRCKGSVWGGDLVLFDRSWSMVCPQIEGLQEYLRRKQLQTNGSDV